MENTQNSFSSHESQIISLSHQHDWQVIMHDKLKDKIVLYHPQKAKSAVSRGNLQTVGVNKICPLCFQSIKEKEQNFRKNDYHNQTNIPPSQFMVRDYFRLLGDQFEQEKRTQRSKSHLEEDYFYFNDTLSSQILNSGYYSRFFKEVRKIGSGGFGAVYLCRHIIDDIDLGEYAVKKVPVGDNKQWLLKVLREVKTLETLNKHPNIVNYQHSWLETSQIADFGPQVPTLFILMELASGGNLADVIWNEQNTLLPEELIWA